MSENHKQRVQKFIALSGFASRRKAEDLIREGRVSIGGKIVGLGDKCCWEDEIFVDGKKIEVMCDKKYFVLNKKKGFVCSNFDKFNKKTVFDLLGDLKKESRGLFSVGRLDKMTEGLLIITNDGEFAQQIIHPSKKLEKEYLVVLNKKLKENDRREIEKGLVLDGYKLKECRINLKGDFLSVIIFEGRKRQIRRMFELKGYVVVKLKRVRIGGLSLDKLKLKTGEVKEVSRDWLRKQIFK